VASCASLSKPADAVPPPGEVQPAGRHTILPREPRPPAPFGFGFLNPLQPPTAELRYASWDVPDERRDQVYFFLINGLDPGWWANLNGLAEYAKWCGFRHTYCGQMMEMPEYRAHMREVRQREPGARIVLLGYSLGANCVRHLAQKLRKDGVRIDLLIYLGGDTIFDKSRSRPDNVDHILNINSHGLILLGGDLYFNGRDLQGATNKRLDTRHICLPSQQEAIEIIVRALMEQANAAGRPPAELLRPHVPRAPGGLRGS
jgi:hypothetical protein